LSVLADELTGTPLERRCLDELRAATGEVDGAMERHCVRCFLLVELLAERRGVEVDREVVLCAALIHDAGAYDRISRGGVYTDDGGAFAEELFLGAGESPERARLVRDACAYHHAVRDQSARGTEVELLRLADRIEVSGGLLRAGLTRAEVRSIFDRVSREGFYTGVAGLLGHMLRERPLTLPRIFKTSTR
jgi:HD domain